MRYPVLLAVLLLFAGCSTLSDRVSQRFSAVQPVERVIQHDEEKIFIAAQQILEEQGYLLTRTAQAQGIIEGRSRRLPSDQFGASEQYVLEIRLRSAQPGVTTVEAVLREQVEGDFASGATSSPLREHGRYDAFFDALESRLGQGN